MATLNIPKGFEKSLLPKDVREKLDPFIDYVNQNVDQIVRAFPNQLTFSENFRGRILNIQAMSNTDVALDIQNVNPQGAIILKSDVAVKSYSLTQSNDGTSNISISFDEPKSIKTRSVSAVSSIFYDYEVDSSSAIFTGDIVSVSGYGNKSNNGEFLVVATRPGHITLINNQSGAGAETKTSFTGTRESFKSVTLLILT